LIAIIFSRKPSSGASPWDLAWNFAISSIPCDQN
jgi:hypothetical protein